MRTIRLCKSALTLLNELHPGALDYYLASFPANVFSGFRDNKIRNHRVGEAIAMCMMAGIETAPYKLPPLQKKSILSVILETPSYYLSRNFKHLCTPVQISGGTSELNKSRYARVVGLLFYPGGCYAAYNTRDAVMKWNGLSELKSKQSLSEIVRMNAGLAEVTSALLFGNSAQIAMQAMIESDKTRKMDVRIDRVYQGIHYIPLDQDGIGLLKLLTLPDWNEKLMSVLFKPEIRPKGHSVIEFDAFWDGKYILSHLDSDIAKLDRLKETLKRESRPFEVLCFPWQTDFVQEHLGDSVEVKQLEMSTVLDSLGIKHKSSGKG
jgi:hypothetical protein